MHTLVCMNCLGVGWRRTWLSPRNETFCYMTNNASIVLFCSVKVKARDKHSHMHDLVLVNSSLMSTRAKLWNMVSTGPQLNITLCLLDYRDLATTGLVSFTLRKQRRLSARKWLDSEELSSAAHSPLGPHFWKLQYITHRRHDSIFACLLACIASIDSRLDIQLYLIFKMSFEPSNLAICETCGTQFDVPLEQHPETCRICDVRPSPNPNCSRKV